MRPIEDFIGEMQEDSEAWFGPADPLIWMLGLVGEAGECADEMKKWLRGSKTEAQMIEKLKVELIDVFHYWCLLIGYYDIDVDEVYRKKREINLVRHDPANRSNVQASGAAGE
jgi:NTP pyrophosphatase (non-canonical NTP hydrolase)